VLTLTTSGSVSDYTDSDKSSLQQQVADAAGVDKSLVTIQVTAASVRITATIAVPASKTADQVKTSLSSSLGGTADDASTALGITVEEGTITSSEETITIIGGNTPLTSDDESSCDGGCVGGITAAVALLALIFVGWLNGCFTRIGCSSPLKKKTQTEQPTLRHPNRDAHEVI